MRMDPRPLLRGHAKALKDSRNRALPDVTTRLVLWGVPPLVGVVAALLHAQVRQPGALLGALALLAGVLIGSVAFISTMRGQMAQRHDFNPRVSDALDETATHLLVAVLVAIADAVMIGAVTSLGDGRIAGVLAGVILMLSTFVVGLLLLIVPRLYMAYVDFHNVGADLNGYKDADSPAERTRGNPRY